jgi:hypothetical protein
VSFFFFQPGPWFIISFTFQTITELQNCIKQLREDIKRAKENTESRVTEIRSQAEEEKQSLKKQYSSNLAVSGGSVISLYLFLGSGYPCLITVRAVNGSGPWEFQRGFRDSAKGFRTETKER